MVSSTINKLANHWSLLRAKGWELIFLIRTKSNSKKGGQLTNSVPMSTWRQPSNPRLRLGLLGCQLVDIGMKLHSVHIAVKFSSASAAPRLLRTSLQSAPCAISSQVELSPTWDWVGKSSSLLSCTFHMVFNTYKTLEWHN